MRDVVLKIDDFELRKTRSLGKMRSVDLFAGVGGLRLGFEKEGFETVFANDIDHYCKETYDLNFNSPKLTVKDLNQINCKDLPKFELLLGGFPCQPFSIAGYRKGFRDTGRGDLFFKIAEIVEHSKPKVVVLENVKNLKTHDNGKTFKIIKKTLEDLGYHVTAQVLNSMKHGNIPQNRERIFIIAFLNKSNFDRFCFPNEKKLKNNFEKLLEKTIDQKYYYEGKTIHEKLVDSVVNKKRVYQWRRKYVRENKSGVVPTLTANMGTGGHNVPIILDSKGIRKLTPKECFNMQGFPKSYKLPKLADSRLYKQAGNSVTVSVVQEIAKQIKKALK